MKIEKINDNQIKLILTQTDLTERNIKLEDLAAPSEKTQALFRDIMEQAFMECNFISENTPLMVEAVPVGMDGIMIIVTKIEHNDGDKNSFRMISQAKDLRRYKKKSLVSFELDDTGSHDLLVYSFLTLDDVIDLSVRLSEVYHGASSLYKYEGRYYLVLQNEPAADTVKIEDLEMILGEYGQKHVSTLLSKYFLVEHGEVILEGRALRALVKSFL